MTYKIFLTLLFINSFAFAQTKGVVKDSVTGQPLPYVSIWVENENIGMTSEEDGSFEIHTNEKSKRLIFSSLGFENKRVDLSKAAVVLLQPKLYALDEVVIQHRKRTKIREIGQTKTAILEAFENGPRIDVKYFPYLPEYQKTRFIKKVRITTDSQIEAAAFKLHFYTVDANGFPATELLNRDYIVTVSKGNNVTSFNVEDFGLTMPKNGLFVGFEKLIIEKNKIEKIITDKDTKSTRLKRTYAPMMLYNRVPRDYLFTFSGGKWNRQENPSATDKWQKIMVNEPAINLILTN